jgi:hypothetical protein
LGARDPKDPIAVGITENGERHLICRWGLDKLIPSRGSRTVLDDQDPEFWRQPVCFRKLVSTAVLRFDGSSTLVKRLSLLSN